MPKETTPPKITPEIENLVATINPSGKLEWVNVVPMENAMKSECFQNVKRAIDCFGGKSINGWAIWQRGNALLDSEAHSIWENKDGDRIDITPHNHSEHNILFLPDKNVVYTGNPIPSHRVALTSSPLVKEFLDLLEERDYLMCKDPESRQYSMPINQYKRILEIDRMLEQKVGRNDPCTCGSGMKYKKCCGRY